jgi:hypothetical protein
MDTIDVAGTTGRVATLGVTKAELNDIVAED